MLCKWQSLLGCGYSYLVEYSYVIYTSGYKVNRAIVSAYTVIEKNRHGVLIFQHNRILWHSAGYSRWWGYVLSAPQSLVYSNGKVSISLEKLLSAVPLFLSSTVSIDEKQSTSMHSSLQDAIDSQAYWICSRDKMTLLETRNQCIGLCLSY